MRRLTKISVVSAIAAFGGAAPAFAQDQAQIDLQAVLQAQQAQQQQQLVAGLSGVQPYCTTYGTCSAALSMAPAPFASSYQPYAGPSLLDAILPGLLGAGLEAAAVQYPPEATPRTTYPVHDHHRRAATRSGETAQTE